MKFRFYTMCWLIEVDNFNAKQKGNKRILAGQDEMTALRMQPLVDNAKYHVRLNDEGAFNFILLVSKNVL